MSKATHAPTTSVSRRSFIAASAAVGAATVPTTAIASPQISPELIAFARSLNEAVAVTNAYLDEQRAAEKGGDHARALELDDLMEPHLEQRSRMEKAIERFPLRSTADLVLLAKTIEHQINYGDEREELAQIPCRPHTPDVRRPRTHGPRYLRRSPDRNLSSSLKQSACQSIAVHWQA